MFCRGDGLTWKRSNSISQVGNEIIQLRRRQCPVDVSVTFSLLGIKVLTTQRNLKCSSATKQSRLLGRARALEVALGCEDFDAEQAERYGYINRALPAAELDDFVSNLAYRIASFPREAIAATKQAMDYSDSNITQGLLEEQHLFNQTRAMPESQRRMAKFMAYGAQTREGELELERIIKKLDE